MSDEDRVERFSEEVSSDQKHSFKYKNSPQPRLSLQERGESIDGSLSSMSLASQLSNQDDETQRCSQSISSCDSWSSSPSNDLAENSFKKAALELDGKTERSSVPEKNIRVGKVKDYDGVGVFCVKAFKQYEVIHIEYPLLQFKVGEDNLDYLVQETLTEDEQKEYYELYDSTANRTDPNPAKKNAGVFRTNAVPVYNDSHWVVLRTFSRINHSCEPNVGFRFENNEVLLYAYRDLKEGEELFISYIDNTMEYEKRQQKLRSRYGFSCKCSSCDLDGPDLIESNKKRALIAEYDSGIKLAINQKNFRQALEQAKSRLALLKSSRGLATPTHLLRTEYDALCASQELGDVDGMRKWFDLAISHAAVAHGRSSITYMSLYRKMDEIRLHAAVNLHL